MPPARVAALVLGLALLTPSAATASPEGSSEASEASVSADALMRAQSVGALFDDPAVTAAAVALVVDEYGPTSSGVSYETSAEGDADEFHAPHEGHEEEGHVEPVAPAAAPAAPAPAAPSPAPQKRMSFQMAAPAAEPVEDPVVSAPGGKPSLTFAIGQERTPLPAGGTGSYGGGFGISVPEGASACPVPGGTFTDTFGAPRGRTRTHQGQDLFAPEGTPILAMVDGTVTKADPFDNWGGSMEGGDLGGITITYTAPNGDRYYNAHLVSLAPGMVKGASVRAGQVIGFVGRSGDARRTPPHLHIEWRPAGGVPTNFISTLNQVC